MTDVTNQFTWEDAHAPELEQDYPGREVCSDPFCFRELPTAHEVSQGTMGGIDASIEECRQCGGLYVYWFREDDD